MELPHPKDPATRILVTEIFGTEDMSPTFISGTIHNLASLKADDPHARELVTKLTQVEDPSPTFVRDAFDGMRIAEAPNGETALEESSSPEWLTDLPTLSPGEKHEAGKNDFMSGAVHTSGQRRKKLIELLALSTRDSNSTVCNSSLNDLLKHMPFMLLSKKAIISFDLYHYPESANSLPHDFLTTPTGLLIVIRHFWPTDDVEAEYEDEELNEQLKMVGGVLENNWPNRYYPKDLFPCAGWKELEACHRDYWRRLHAMTFPEMGGMDVVDEEEL